MSMMSPELARAVHDDRRRRLLTDAEERRTRRDLRGARRLRAPGGARIARLAGLVAARLRAGRGRDPKIARLAESWLALDERTARELARVADELVAPAGTRLVPGRFSYLGLDDAHCGMVVAPGTPPVTIRSSATVLVLTTVDLDTILPALRHQATAWTEADPAPRLTVGRRDRVVRRRPTPERAPLSATR